MQNELLNCEPSWLLTRTWASVLRGRKQSGPVLGPSPERQEGPRDQTPRPRPRHGAWRCLLAPQRTGCLADTRLCTPPTARRCWCQQRPWEGQLGAPGAAVTPETQGSKNQRDKGQGSFLYLIPVRQSLPGHAGVREAVSDFPPAALSSGREAECPFSMLTLPP